MTKPVWPRMPRLVEIESKEAKQALAPRFQHAACLGEITSARVRKHVRKNGCCKHYVELGVCVGEAETRSRELSGGVVLRIQYVREFELEVRIRRGEIALQE